MSTKTRQEQRRKRVEIPIETDWLWSCSRGMPLSDIGRSLRFTDEPHTELSARSWADERTFRDDLYCALFPTSTRIYTPGARVIWDALDDDLRDACTNGRLIVIRDLPTAVPHAVQMLILIIGVRRRERGFHTFESRTGARFALILEDWAQPTIRVRSRRASIYVVTPVHSTSAAPQTDQDGSESDHH
jgi:hypothetical protein